MSNKYTFISSFSMIPPLSVTKEEFEFYSIVEKAFRYGYINELQFVQAQWALITDGWIEVG